MHVFSSQPLINVFCLLTTNGLLISAFPEFLKNQNACLKVSKKTSGLRASERLGGALGGFGETAQDFKS